MLLQPQFKPHLEYFHTDQKPYNCEICDKTVPSHRINHIKNEISYNLYNIYYK